MQEEKKKLVNQARKGDTHAFAKLYEEIYPDLYRFAFCMVRQPWKAEDVVSDAVLKAFEKIHTLKKPESFRSWIFQIAANECRLQYRKEKRVVFLACAAFLLALLPANKRLVFALGTAAWIH